MNSERIIYHDFDCSNKIMITLQEKFVSLALKRDMIWKMISMILLCKDESLMITRESDSEVFGIYNT